MKYRKKDCALMLQKLNDNPDTIARSKRNVEITKWCKERIDESWAFKSIWVTNALSGSEDYLVSDKIFAVVGETTRSFRSDMMQK